MVTSNIITTKKEEDKCATTPFPMLCAKKSVLIQSNYTFKSKLLKKSVYILYDKFLLTIQYISISFEKLSFLAKQF